MAKEKVAVRLYNNGDYTIEDIPSCCATQWGYGYDEKGEYITYRCSKSKQYHYLLKLIDIKKKDATKKVAELVDTIRRLDNMKKDIAEKLDKKEIEE